MITRKPGRHDIIAEYVRHHKEQLYRLAYGYVHNADDALDIVQDSIQKAIAANTLKDDQAIRSWFYKIVVNTSLDFLRRSRKIRVMDDTTLELHAPSHQDHYRDMDLRQALENLPVPYRSVIVLRYFEDLKIEEVADILDLNVNTVKTRLYKGLKMLRIRMEPDQYEEAQSNGNEPDGKTEEAIPGDAHPFRAQ